MNLPKSSSKFNEEFVCKYSNPRADNRKSVWGFKLVVDKGENFYSVGTGMYRYQKGKVLKRNANYSNVYKDTDYYCKYMVGKTAIFNSLNDLKTFYPDWNDNNVCILYVQLSGDIITIDAENKYYKCRVYAGSEIKNMERI